jgi:hypothetical protein
MEIGSLFVILALLILVGLFVSRPFFEKKTVAVDSFNDPLGHEVSALLAERDRVLNALQELDFDATLGKIPQEDYPIQRNILLQQGAVILRRLDELQGETTAGISAEDRIEAVVANRRADASAVADGVSAQEGQSTGAEPDPEKTALSTSDDSVETMLANRRRQRQGKAVGFCAQCGGPLQQADHFCPKCGAMVV